MKTETQIAEYFIKNIKKYGFRQSAEQHKEDSQRFLEFLKELESHKVSEHRKYQSVCEFCIKITDLKQARTKYEENGI